MIKAADNSPLEPEPQGGLGGGTRDTRLVELAVRKRWNMPEKVAETLPEKLMEIFESEDKADRDRLSAAKTLVTMMGQNQADDHKAQPDLHLHAHTTVQSAHQELLEADPDYIEYLRQKALNGPQGVPQNGSHGHGSNGNGHQPHDAG